LLSILNDYFKSQTTFRHESQMRQYTATYFIPSIEKGIKQHLFGT